LQEHFGYGYDKAWNLNYRTNNALVETFNVHPVRYGATGSGWRPRGQPVTASRVGCMYLSHGVNNLNELATNTRSGTLTVAGTATEAGAYVTGVTVSGTGLSSGSANVYADGTWARSGAILANGTNTYTATAQDTYGRQDTGTVTVNLPLTNSFAYDLNGNLLSDGNRNFAYDDENQLISVWVTNVWRSDFLYDGMMRRRIRREYLWQSGTWTLQSEIHYVYDGNLVVQERWFASSPAGLIAQDTITYTRGSDLSGSLQGAGGIGGLLARTDNGQLTAGLSSAHAYYHCDGNGNVTALVDTNGVILARYTYDPYGNILSLSGPLAAANLYRFSSKEWHPNSGLVYYGRRFYDPDLQRWMNRDPIMELAYYINPPRARFAAEGPLDTPQLRLRYAILSRVDGSTWVAGILREPDNEIGLFNCYEFNGGDAVALLDPWGLRCFLDRAGQFARGVGVLAGGLAAALVSEGPQALITVPTAVTAIGYGVGNIVASFAPEANNEAARQMLESPASAPEALGRAIGGQNGQMIGAAAGAATGLVNGINEGNFLDLGESGADAMYNAMDAANAACTDDEQ